MPSERLDKCFRPEPPNITDGRLPSFPISYHTGDATRPIGDGPKILVHVCNDIGAWGRGFVVALTRCWPEPEQHYRAWHRGRDSVPFELGQVQFVPVSESIVVANLVG